MVVATEFVGGIKTDSLLKTNGDPFPTGANVVMVRNVPNANYNVVSDDYLIIMSPTQNRILTLQTAITPLGRVLVIKNQGTKSIVVTALSGQLIDRSSTYTLIKQSALTIISNGIDWVVV